MATFRLNEVPVDNKAVQEVQQPDAVAMQAGQTTPGEEGKSGVIKEIVLKGPLGHAYTEALQLLLCKETNATGDIRQENMQQAIQAQFVIDEETPVSSLPENAKGFIYVYDGKKMSLGDVNNMFDDLAAVKEAHPQAGYVNGTIENAGVLLDNPRTASSLEMLTAHMESIGVSLHFSRTSSLNSILGFCRKGQ